MNICLKIRTQNFTFARKETENDKLNMYNSLYDLKSTSICLFGT